MSDTNTTADNNSGSTPTDATVDPAARINRRKVKEGIVASAAMNKSIVVAVVDKVRHERYSKTIQRTVRLHVHDEENEAKAGDRVRVQETRPLSKTKRWRLVEILERAR